MTPSAADPAAVTAIFAALPDLPAWRRPLVRRRVDRLFGETWRLHVELWPWNPDSPAGSMERAATAYEHRLGGEGVLLTEGLVHRTLSQQVFSEEEGERLSHQLRRLASAR